MAKTSNKVFLSSIRDLPRDELYSVPHKIFHFEADAQGNSVAWNRGGGSDRMAVPEMKNDPA
jgi:hypothetical protein